MTAFQAKRHAVGTPPGGRRGLPGADRALTLRPSALAAPEARAPGLVFLFGGAGAQWAGMGRALLDALPVARATLERCDQELWSLSGWSLVDRLLQGDPGLGDPDRHEIYDPAVVALEIALAAQWAAWGVSPGVVVGHSIGEAAAAQVAGALSLRDALRVAREMGLRYRRGVEQGDAALLFVGLSGAPLEAALAEAGGGLTVAADNGPTASVICGPAAALRAAARALSEAGIYTARVSGIPAHCAYAEPFVQHLDQSLSGLAPRAARAAFWSTVEAGPVDGASLDARYWRRNMAEPVRFRQTVAALIAAGHRTFLELSPHAVLSRDVTDGLRASGVAGEALLSQLRQADPLHTLASAALRLEALGLLPDWPAELGPARAAIAQEQTMGAREAPDAVGGGDAAAGRALSGRVAALAAAVLGVPASTLEPSRSLLIQGLDSLKWVQLRERLARELGASLETDALLRSPTLGGLADAVARALSSPGPAAAVSGPGCARGDAVLSAFSLENGQRATEGTLTLIYGPKGPILIDFERPCRWIWTRRDEVLPYSDYWLGRWEDYVEEMVALIRAQRIRQVNLIGVSKAGFGAVGHGAWIARRLPEVAVHAVSFSGLFDLRRSEFESVGLPVPESVEQLHRAPAMNRPLAQYGQLLEAIQGRENLRISYIFPAEGWDAKLRWPARLRAAGATVESVALPVEEHNTLYPFWFPVGTNTVLESWEDGHEVALSADDLAFFAAFQEVFPPKQALYSLLDDPAGTAARIRAFAAQTRPQGGAP